jgi:KaiC/GvpD/RAD55 family RecA-like ATPase
MLQEELTPMEILQENIPAGVSMLIVGPPGSGKTILSQQLVYQSLKRRRSAICIASKSQINLIMSQKKLFNWRITSYLRNKQFTAVEIGDIADPTELNISLTQAIRKSRGKLSLVVMDSLTVLMVGMEPRKIMKFTEALTRKLQDQGVSLILLATPSKETEDFLTKMKSLVSSVIEITLKERGTIRRYMRIFKFLERKHSTQWYPFEIIDEGIQFPVSPTRAPHPDIIVLPKMMALEEVSTPYSGLDHLLERIRKENLSCILENRNASGQGVMLFSEGERLISVLVGKDGTRSNAPQLLENAIKTLKGTVILSSISSEITPLLMGYLKDQVLFRNLSSDQIRFEDIVENLSDSEFSGCILLRGEEEQGLIFFSEGEIIEAYFEDEHILFSREALSAFEDAASRGNFQVDIYFSAKMEKPKKREQQITEKVPGAVLPEFVPLKGSTVQGSFINATFTYLQNQNSAEWSSVEYYPRPLKDIAVDKVESEILRLKALKDPYLRRDMYKLRRVYKDREWYPAEEYQDIVYAVTRMLQFTWTYENHNQYEEGWGKLSKAFFELGKTVPQLMGNTEKRNKKTWYNYFMREIKKWKDMGGFSDCESKKEGEKLVLQFKGDLELPPRRKGMLWGLLERLGLPNFDIHYDGKEYIVSFY